MERLMIIILLFCCTSPVIAQRDTLKRTLSWQQPVVDFEIDRLGNLYLVGANRQIKKINYAFDSLGVFNEVKQFGELHQVDVSNPLKTLLFYKDFATIVILDRFMQVKSAIDLRKLGFLQVTAIGQSYDNKIWVYDEMQAKLFKIDEEGNRLMESADFRQLFRDELPQPVTIIDQGNKVYLADTIRNIIIMDYYGAMQGKLAADHINDVHFVAKSLAGRVNNQVMFWPEGKGVPERINLPATQFETKKFRIYNSAILILDASGAIKEYPLPAAQTNK